MTYGSRLHENDILNTELQTVSHVPRALSLSKDRRVKLSIVVPIHLTFASRYILNRIERCISHLIAGAPGSDIVIVLSGTAPLTSRALSLLRQFSIITVITWEKPTSPYSPGIARNLALSQCKNDNLLFWDIDLLGSPGLFKAIPNYLGHIAQKNNAFYMFPCIYLTKSYSEKFRGDFGKLFADTTSLKENVNEHLALATSTLLCSKEHFLKLGRFDEAFKGHMGEDLELINRLAMNFPQYSPEEDHSVNLPSKNPSEQKGFRKLFSYYSIPLLLKEEFTCHLFHNTRLDSEYKNNQNANTSLLERKIKDSIYSITLSPISPFKYKQKFLTSAPIIRYSILEKLKRKMMKLLRNSKRFFADM